MTTPRSNHQRTGAAREAASPLATPEEAAEFMRSTTQKLADQRYRGNGPRYVKNGKYVLYRWSDLEAYVEANTFQRTDDRPVAI